MQAMQAHLVRSLGTTQERFGVDQKKEGRASQEKPPLYWFTAPKSWYKIHQYLTECPKALQTASFLRNAQEAALSVWLHLSPKPKQGSLSTPLKGYTLKGSHEFKKPSINKQQKLTSKNGKSGGMLLRKIKGRRRRQHRMKWLDGIINSMDMSLSKLRETVKEGKPGVLQSLESQRVRHVLATEQQQQKCLQIIFLTAKNF